MISIYIYIIINYLLIKTNQWLCKKNYFFLNIMFKNYQNIYTFIKINRKILFTCNYVSMNQAV